MENNALFAILLRTLGYRIRSCGARTHDGKVFGAWYVGWMEMIHGTLD